MQERLTQVIKTINQLSTNVQGSSLVFFSICSWYDL